jgi:hypothetical protein
MMENRSFDRILGFLQNDGLDVEVIAGAKPNFDRNGNEYQPFEARGGRRRGMNPGSALRTHFSPLSGKKRVFSRSCGRR